MKSNILSRIVVSLVFIAAGFSSSAQETATLTGVVTDDNGEPLYDATVIVAGTQIGTKTDFDGKFELTGIPVSGESEVKEIVIRGIGVDQKSFNVEFKPGETVTRNFSTGNALNLDDVVVIGYGTTRTKDLTGAATKITEEDFNDTPAASPEQLIQGKVAGVKINTNGGAPGSGSTIRLRGGTSINASNDPLIVVDGVPLDNGGIAGAPSPLSLINPADIESFVILKDASAAAIYGSRGANGVILITTKNGYKEAFNVRATIGTTVSQNVEFVNVLTGDQFRDLVNTNGLASQAALLGDANTDWQREIYRTGLIQNYNVSVGGGFKPLPYRLSLGARIEDGILKRDQMNRYNVGLNLNPRFFDNTLRVDVSVKYARTNTFFADRGAIGSAILFDPTQPVQSGNDAYGGYFEWLNSGGDPQTLAPKNPVGLLNQREDYGIVDRLIGNVRMTYKLPFAPRIKAVVNGGTDISTGRGETSVLPTSAAGFFSDGSYSQYTSNKRNKLLEAYVNYNSDSTFKNWLLDATAGYAWQDWQTSTPSFATYNYDQDSIIFPENPNPFFTANALLSFYGRGIATYKDRYVLTATLRRDGSSRFSPATRWGWFPSVSGAWMITEEKFMKKLKKVNLLKLRGGFGVTGQQDIGADYPYIPNYQQGTLTAQYYFGGTYYTVLRPDGYDASIKWEETQSYNIGLDFGMFKDRISGTIDLYYKRTDDLLAVVPVMAGTNFTNQILTNVGSMDNRGIEIAVNGTAMARKNFRWDIGVNATYNRNEVLNLTQVPDPDSPGIPVGGIAGGIGNNVQIHSVGFPTFTYFVFEQQYDAAGQPIEVGQTAPNGSTYTELDAFVDRNEDGVINEEDRYRFGQSIPDWFFGLNMNFEYKRWFAGFSMRGEVGGYNYNNIHSVGGTFQGVGTSGFLSNLSSFYFENEIQTLTDKQLLSDHYLEKADFIKIDYITVGYKFKKYLTASFTVNNAFIFSNYSGIDPEINGGIDLNVYPRPRLYSINLSFRL
ncbi:MAG: SusC/RagA family protein [Fluviicola sp. XM-24bin1]|nr:MAG: SusC/RagA family protein [Fluviicola sp. XM-24bin1]